MHPGERSEQRYAFQTEEIRQRVLVDHTRADGGVMPSKVEPTGLEPVPYWLPASRSPN
jgi:hypothetical protein